MVSSSEGAYTLRHLERRFVEAAKKMDAVKTAKRTLDIFEAFAAAQEPLTLSDLARRIGSPVSSCHGVIRTLKAHGYVYLLDKRRYYPTRKLLDLGSRISPHDPVMERLVPHLEALRKRTEETVMIGKREGDEILYVVTIESLQTIRYALHAGDRRPVHASAVGKALLGLLPDERLQEELRRLKMKRYTDATLDAEGLLADLRKSRRRGFFATRGEYDAGGMGIARAFVIQSEPYAVGIAGPLARLKNKMDTLGRLVSDTAAAMERAAASA
jgi:IclR family transcriptional regulator, acetate operon repressor